MPKVYDNIELKLIDGLKSTIENSTSFDCCVGYFNLRGWQLLAPLVDKLAIERTSSPVCRLIVGMNFSHKDAIKELYNNYSFLDDNEISEEDKIDNETAINYKKQLAKEFKEQLTFGLPSNASENALRQLKHQLEQKQLEIKLHTRYPLHAKLYIAHLRDRNRLESFLGSSNLTMSGLSKQGELNVDVEEQDQNAKLSKWFKDRWEDRFTIDISKEIIEVIDNSWASENLIQPFLIYLKMAYHLSYDVISGLNEFVVDSDFEEILTDFQADAVSIASRKLYRNGGIIIGDVVGLGKSLIASAIIRQFEFDFGYSTLIICPAKLTAMWNKYKADFNLKAEVLSMSQLLKLKDNSKGNYSRFKMVVIDESHNFRSRETEQYSLLNDFLSQNECKVVLLTATPYNKSFEDLANQLRLFVDDDFNLGFKPEKYIESIGGMTEFNKKHTDTPATSIRAFELSSFKEDWQDLIKTYMLRRTRTFLKESGYAKYDDTNQRYYIEFKNGNKSYFAERVPKSVTFELNVENEYDLYSRLYSEKVVEIIKKLELPRYGMFSLLDENKIKSNSLKLTKDEITASEHLKKSRNRLKGYTYINLFKRLESSGYSFLLSIARHILRNSVYEYALANGLDLPIGKNIDIEFDYLTDNETKDLFTDTISNIDNVDLLTKLEDYSKKAKLVYDNIKAKGKNYLWVRAELFLPEFKEQLISDSLSLIEIIKIGNNWEAKEDRKLAKLLELVNKTHKNEKVLIFTQYSDTAKYLKEYLAKYIQNIDIATGDSSDILSITKKFSPISNNSKKSDNDTRVLIATDVLSEGQNLQDCNIIINYDLPWAIITLIQRAGRVDRIGQAHNEILCYSFKPESGVEDIIRLRKRLKERFDVNADVIGADEKFFDDDDYQLKSLYNQEKGILDDQEDMDVDLSSYAYQIWKNAIAANPELEQKVKNLSNVVHSTMQKDELKGLVLYARTVSDNDVLSWVDNKGEIITNSHFRILKALECNLNTPPHERQENHYELEKNALDYIKGSTQNNGIIARRRSVRFKIYNKLETFRKANKGTLFDTISIDSIIELVHNNPLTEYAKIVIQRELKANTEDNKLIEKISSLYRDGELCVMSKKEQNETQIICSMGII